MLVRHRTYTPQHQGHLTGQRLGQFDRSFDHSFDRAFEQLTNSFFETRRGMNSPVVDGAWRDDEYVLTVDLPGVPAEAVSVEVTGTTLALRASTDDLQWVRSVRLGERLDPDKIQARHVDGRLTVRIGAVDEPESRAVAIDTSAPERAIEATASDTGADDGPSADTQSTETNDTE